MSAHHWILETLMDISMYAEKNDLSITHSEINSMIVNLSSNRELSTFAASGTDNVHYISHRK